MARCFPRLSLGLSGHASGARAVTLDDFASHRHRSSGVESGLDGLRALAAEERGLAQRLEARILGSVTRVRRQTRVRGPRRQEHPGAGHGTHLGS